MNPPAAPGVYRADATPTAIPVHEPAHDPPVTPARTGGRRSVTIDLTVVHVDRPRDFETFYRESYADIAAALTVTLGDLDLAQEATDEAMVRAYVRWEKIRAYDNPGGWVYRVGLNWARSARRRLTRALPFHERPVVDATGDRSRALRRVARPRRRACAPSSCAACSSTGRSTRPPPRCASNPAR